MKISNEAIDVTLSVLNNIPSLHWKSCFEDDSGRPDFDCNCPVKNITEKLIDIKLIRKNKGE